MAHQSLSQMLAALAETHFDAFELLPYASRIEKLLALALTGPPAGPARVTAPLAELAHRLRRLDTSGVKTVVFGGGTGLANIIGGDSRAPDWPRAPFAGLKALFPQLHAVVCVTDDGGSTGELLKELPLIALGDLRHVLLSAVRQEDLQKRYDLTADESLAVAAALHRLFNHRFASRPPSVAALMDQAGVDPGGLPGFMGKSLALLLKEIFASPSLAGQLGRPHCLGNLLVAAAVHQQAGGLAGDRTVAGATLMQGLGFLAELLGAPAGAVLPSTVTPAHLKLCYDNGVLVSGESKSSQARRRCPVDRVFVEFARKPEVPSAVIEAIGAADLILFAPGSLYTSIVPILHVPGIAEAVRANQRAMKVLISNLWVQAGETDLARSAPGRRFQVSDLLIAYHRNIPGGIEGLFRQVLVMGLRDIPGSILQSYALENKHPIFLDRQRVQEMGVVPLEAPLFSQQDIDRRRVVQHDPAAVAAAVQSLWALRELVPAGAPSMPVPAAPAGRPPLVNPRGEAPSQRQAAIAAKLAPLDIEQGVRSRLEEVCWRHWDIQPAHLDFFAGLRLVPREEWRRSQEWDRIYSFYEPEDRLIRIRRDVAADPVRFEVAFLVALGQSLLGDYAAAKRKLPLVHGGEEVGYVYELLVRPEGERQCFLDDSGLERYLLLARMQPSSRTPRHYTRVVNGGEGFTPPGLLFGLTFCWYLDNRYVAHVEYKMAILRAPASDLVPEQLKTMARRRAMIDFFRTVVFRYDALAYNESNP